ncbi:MAG TPA: nuclear transport factor 2 family protein [Terriglobales bacterium]|nr:nuclear transport factor 2 family protein [Terriglobales bacterium]
MLAKELKALEEKLIAKERAILAAQKRGDLDAVAGALADGFHEIGKGAKFYSKADVIKALQDATEIADYSLEQFRLLPVHARCVIITYISTVRRSSRGNNEAARAYRSSTWIEQGGSWRMIFHQGTPISLSPTL